MARLIVAALIAFVVGAAAAGCAVSRAMMPERDRAVAEAAQATVQLREARVKLDETEAQLREVRGLPYDGIHPCIKAYPEADRFVKMVVPKVKEIVGQQWAFQACALYLGRVIFEVVAPDGRYQVTWAWDGDWWRYEASRRQYPPPDIPDGDA